MNASRWLAVCTVCIWVVLELAASTWQWQALENRGFDLLTVTSPLEVTGRSIVVIGIDEPSFADLGLQWPWPRRLHSHLIDELNRQGAAVVAMDVIFADLTFS